MQSDVTKQNFFVLAEEWVCESYSLCIRYTAYRNHTGLHIVNASAFAYPLPIEQASDFSIDIGDFLAGQKTFSNLPHAEVIKKLNDAAAGVFQVDAMELKLEYADRSNFYSELPSQNTWLSGLHLGISTQPTLRSISFNSTARDTALRRTAPPFDGMADLQRWLGFDNMSETDRASIEIRIDPPVDMQLAHSKLERNSFSISLIAHPKFEPSKLNFAIREFPGSGLQTRKQLANEIKWSNDDTGMLKGSLNIPLINADSILTMLTLDSQTIRHHWFVDPDKAINTRYVATQLFDKDLKRLKWATVDQRDQDEFEKGIASLLFLLGFSAAIQIETDSPDILLTTPNGQLAIVECTLKIADFSNKLGKLVDRRNALMQSLKNAGHNSRVEAFLICGVPKARIAIEDRQLIQHQVTLLCQENISDAFNQLRNPRGPDLLLDEAASALAKGQHAIG